MNDQSGSEISDEYLLNDEILQLFRPVSPLRYWDQSVRCQAVHRPSGQRVELRVYRVSEVGEDAIDDLQRARRLLNDTNSKPLNAPLYVVEADGQVAAAYQLLTGDSVRTLLDQIKNSQIDGCSGLGVARSLMIAIDILKAIQRAHSRDVLHGSIKPSRVIRSEEDSGEYHVTGFGRPRTLPQTTSLITDVNDDVFYLPPENTGSLDFESGTWSDLYSVGAVLFECLTGSPPFVGNTIGEVLTNQMTLALPDPRDLGIAIPRAMGSVLQRLLYRTPRDRYQTAGAALFDIQQIFDALEAGDTQPRIVCGLRDRRTTLTEPAFIGREEELLKLESQLELAKDRGSRMVFVEGESASGKSRLLEELTQHARRKNFRVFQGIAKNATARRPFEIISGVCEQIIELAKDERFLFQIEEYLGEHRAAVGAALPELGNALNWIEQKTQGPEAFGEMRSLHALAALLRSLGSPDQPAVVILDDCQWADELTYKFIRQLREMLRSNSSAESPLVLIVGFRTEETEADHFLRTITPSAHVCLTSFSLEETRDLLNSSAGILPHEVAPLVYKLSGGSPFMATAVLRGMVESHALYPGKNGWVVDSQAMARVASSSKAADVLASRIDLLPEAAVDFLQIGAVLGKEFDLELAASLLGYSPEFVLEATRHARSRHLLWVREDKNRCEFVHDRIRESLLERIDDERRQDVHWRAAKAIQARSPRRIYDLAYHFDAANRPEDALPYALEAAEEARHRHAYEVAQQQFRIAEKGLSDSDESARLCVHEFLGEVLMLRGRYDEAEHYLKSAAELATDGFVQARLTCKWGELCMKRGNMEQATEAFETTLRMLGRSVPRRSIVFFLLMIWETAIQAAHSLFPKWLVGVRKLPSTADRLAWKTHSRLAHGYWFVRGSVHVLWTHLRGMNLAEKYEPTLELAQAYSEHAPAMSLVPWYERGIDYAKRSLAIRTNLDDTWGQGQSLSYLGVVLHSAGRHQECIENCREAARRLERTGDFWEVHIARYQTAASLYRLGRLEEAAKEARLIQESGLRLGDTQASGIALDVWSRANAGGAPEVVLAVELQRKRHDAQGIAQVMLGEGARLVAAKKYEEAAAVFEAALEQARKAGVMNTYVAPNISWLATALLAMAAENPGYNPSRRHKLLMKARRVARRALRVAGSFQNDLPHAQRNFGLVQAMLGKMRAARKYLRLSYQTAQSQQARYEETQSLQAYGKVGCDAGWDDAEEHLALASQKIREYDLQPMMETTKNDANRNAATLSLVDRFSKVLDTGRKIALQLKPEQVFEETQKATLSILRAETVHFLHVAENGKIRNQQDLLGADRELCELAMDQGKTIIGRLRPAESPARIEGQAASGVASDAEVGFEENGSALAAPIFVRGRVAAVLCARHAHVQGLFGENEQRLADFVSTIAGAALENAEGFAELSNLNQTLEARVAERTQAAESRARELGQSNTVLKEIATTLRRKEDELRVAIIEAEKANEAKSAFLATMSHEIRTPLNGVLGMAELALQTELNERQAKYIGGIKQSGKSLLTLLNDILDISKIESGRMDLEEAPFSLRQVLTETIDLMSASSVTKGISLTHQIDSTLPANLIGDSARLRQVVLNLIGNAIKFTTVGGVHVDVLVKNLNDANVSVELRIIDSGIGIPKESHHLIFESFRQADNSTTRKFGGTGLGLSICSQIVDLMAGKIRVESEPGEGTTFIVNLGFRIAHNVVEAPASDAAPIDDKSTPSTETPSSAESSPEPVALKILLAEDAPLNQEIAVELLQLLGHEVAVANNGQEAVDGWEENDFDLILMDVEMPEMDGLEATQLIRQKERDNNRGHTPIVAMTAHALPEFREKALGSGMDYFITKPVEPMKLQEVIAKTRPMSVETV